MNGQWTDLLDKLPAYLGGHIVLSFSSLAAGLVISLPLGILASHRPKLREWALGAAGVIETVPSLALLALMVPLLGGRIGFVPAFIALTLYSILPILTNTVVGIRGVEPALIEAAQGLGMSPWQMLFRVELPLAAPTIIAGIRTAAVLVVGTATLATPVGGMSLGNYIFGGLESLNHLATVFGCVLAALLALALDQLVRLLEVATRRRQRRLGQVAVATLLVLVVGSVCMPLSRRIAVGKPRALVASGPFTEQHILGELLARRLERAGIQVDQRPEMSSGLQLESLFDGQTDCLVNYTGNIWTLVMKRKDFADRRTTLAEITRYLDSRYGVTCLGLLGFDDAFTFAMPRSRAAALGIHTIADLARHAADSARSGRPLRIGGDLQFFDRPEWRKVKETYSLAEGQIQAVAMNPALMWGAVADGQVDVIVAYTSDGRIRAFELEILSDTQNAFPSYDAILLVSSRAARRPELLAALEPLVGAISQEAMQQANYRVDVEKWPARRVAESLLANIER